VAKRNGAEAFYSLERFVDEESGIAFITCETRVETFPETAETWLFRGVSDEDVAILLRHFLREKTRCTFELLRHFMRLLATKGDCVAHEVKEILAITDWESYCAPSYLLASLARIPDGKAWILRLLDVVPADARDGLFTACWYCDDFEVQEKLRAKFELWIEMSSWGGGDMEDVWL
jgi:hypothetical protein